MTRRQVTSVCSVSAGCWEVLPVPEYAHDEIDAEMFAAITYWVSRLTWQPIAKAKHVSDTIMLLMAEIYRGRA